MAEQKKQKQLSPAETAAFCGQMYLILKSGISAVEGISILMEDAPTDSEKQILSTIYHEILERGYLAPALKASGVFPDYLINMTSLGEETGTLDEVMKALQTHYDREDSIAKSVRSALAYPLIMIGMMFLVVVVLITKVMPVFQQVFRQLGHEMTGFPKAILSLGTTMTNYATLFSCCLTILVLIAIYMFRSTAGKEMLMKIGYKFRFSRNLYEKTSACRFAGGMHLSLKSGINPERALEFTLSLIDNPYYKAKVEACKALVEEGTDISVAFQQTKVFTGIYARLTSIAGKSGTMDEVMEHISSQYEAEIQERLTDYISRLEPTLVIILSAIVGVILFSVMLPLLGIMSGL